MTGTAKAGLDTAGSVPTLAKILRYLPDKFSAPIVKYISANPAAASFISEIRLRLGALFSITAAGKNISIFGGERIYCTPDDMSQALGLLCEDSIHTYGDTMREGYILLDGGYRIGICGHARCEGNALSGVYGITAISVRIPHGVYGVCDEILPLIHDGGRINSTLIYSPPGVGKTTLLRDIAVKLRGRRISLIDTRGELFTEESMANTLIDVLYGYPRAKGIEIATRTMSAEVIICDEIGSAEEAGAILSAQNSGVPLIASAHADSLSSLFMRPNIRLLREHGIFRYYIGLSRAVADSNFRFEIYDAAGGEPC